MAFVPAPKDLSKVKTKVALNLTKRQLICFSLGGAVSIPVYLIFKGISGNEVSMMALIIIAFPFFFMGNFSERWDATGKVYKLCDSSKVSIS